MYSIEKCLLYRKRVQRLCDLIAFCRTGSVGIVRGTIPPALGFRASRGSLRQCRFLRTFGATRSGPIVLLYKLYLDTHEAVGRARQRLQMLMLFNRPLY